MKILIIAGNRQQAQVYADTHKLKDWEYADEEKDFLGLDNFETVYVGEYWKNPLAGNERLVMQQIISLTKQKDNAYHERNMILAALTKIMIAGLARHPDDDKDWEDDWRNIVVIMGIREDFSLVQMTWHIHDSEMPMFAHLQPMKFTWDGHTTEEKYARLASMKPNTGGVFPKDENNTN